MQTLEIQTFILDNSLSFAVNKKIAGQIFPLTQYYSWPVSAAYEQLKVELDSRSGISAIEKHKILNLVVNIIQSWRQLQEVEKIRFFSAKEQGSIDVKLVGFS